MILWRAEHPSLPGYLYFRSPFEDESKMMIGREVGGGIIITVFSIGVFLPIEETVFTIQHQLP